jgi:hypothetical protein
MSFFENTRKPTGFGGKVMVNMMNLFHVLFAVLEPKDTAVYKLIATSRARLHQRDDRITNAAHFSNSNVFRYNFSVRSKK